MSKELDFTLNYKIDFNKCYPTSPCKHDVTKIKKDGTEEIIKHMCSKDIIELIVNTKSIVESKNFEHFKPFFTKPEHNQYLDVLKNYEKENEAFAICTDSKIIHDTLHHHPEITYTAKSMRRADAEHKHLIKLTSFGVYSYGLICSKIKEQIPEHHLFLSDVMFIKKGQKLYPDDFDIILKEKNIQFIGKCMPHYKTRHNELFSNTAYIDDDIEVQINSEEVVDEVYFSIISIPFGNSMVDMNINNPNYWFRKRLIIYYHKPIYDLNNINGYFSGLYLYSSQFDNIKSISLRNKDIVLLDKVSPAVLMVEVYLLFIQFSFGDHGIKIDKESNFEINYELYDDLRGYDIKMYGEQCGIFGKYVINNETNLKI